MPAPAPFNPVEIIDRVTSFYETAWNHLLWFIGVAGAIVGVAVPLLIQFYQRRLFRVREQEIKQELAEQIRVELEKRFSERAGEESKQLDEKISKLEASMESDVADAIGGIFYLQGTMSFDKSKYVAAVTSFCTAAKHWMKANHQTNLQKALYRIQDDCLPKLDREDFKLPGVSEGITQLMESLHKENEAGRYTNFIEKLDYRFKIAQQKEPVTTTKAPQK